MTTFILAGSVLLAVGFAVMWIGSPAFRRRIERPKHLFTEQVRQYDEAHREPGGVTEADSSDAR